MSTDAPTTYTKAKTLADSNYTLGEAIGMPPALDSKESRTAMTKCLNALDDLTDDQRTRVVRAVAVLYGIKLS